jgi:cyclomaltodextrinase / maltogenic alpha-amylase / neopullulanase
VFRFLNNNDTGARFVTAHGVPATRVAAALLLTLPGVPCVYTGDEVGAAYEPYTGPPPIAWDDPDGLRPWYRTLIGLRTRTPSLPSPAWPPFRSSPPGAGLVAYLRHAEDGSAPLLVVLNFGRDACDARVPVPDGFPAVAGAARFRDLVTGRTVTPADGSPLSIHMAALSAHVLAPEGGAT